MIEKQFTLLAGVSESGKNLFAFRYLLNHPDRHALRVIFDPDGENARRLRLPLSESAAQLDAAAVTGWCAWQPAALFGTDLPTAFAFACDWALALGNRTGRRVILFADEVWQYCDPYKLPDALARVLQTGRKANVEGVFGAQRPNKVNGSLWNEATEIVAFRIQERAGLTTMDENGFERDEVATLPFGSFVALNKRNGASLRGKVY